MAVIQAVDIRVRLLILAVATVFVGVVSPSTFAFDDCPSALEDSSGNTCGNDRGHYVLHPNGVALWTTANSDDEAVLMVREPNEFGSLTERILMSYEDAISGFGTVVGLGSHPHGNAAGQAVWQASAGAENSWQNPTRDCLNLLDGLGNEAQKYVNTLLRKKVEAGLIDPGDCYGQGLFVSAPESEPTMVAKSFQALGDTTICTEGVQPWPQIGPSGHYVFGAAVRFAGDTCNDPDDGDADPNFGYGGYRQEYAESQASFVARIDRIVIGTFPIDRASAVPRDVTLHYTVLDGKAVDGTTYYFRAHDGLAEPDLVRIPSNFDSYTSSAWSPGTEANSITASINNGNLSEVCTYTGCDVDTTGMGYYLATSNPTTDTSARVPYTISSGSRAIARGRVGEDGPTAILKSARAPAAAGMATQFSTDASNTAVNDPGHPLAVGGMVSYFARQLDAITHSGRMVGSDGSFVVRATVQAAPADVYWPGENTFGDGDGWSRGIVHVNAAGTPSLIANSTSGFRYLTGALMTSANGVLYRASYNDNDYDLCDRQWTGNYNTGNCAGLQVKVSGFSGAPADDEVATGADMARAGEWYPQNVTLVDATDPSSEIGLGALNCDNDRQECALLVSTDSPTSGSDYAMWVSIDKRPKAGIDTAGNNLELKVRKADLFDAQALGDLADQQREDDAAALADADPATGIAYVYFPLGADTVIDFSQYREEFANELRVWNASSDTTSVIFANRQTSPAGYSKLTGIPKHFSEGDGVVGFKTRLTAPYYSQGGGSGDNPNDPWDASAPADTILGAAKPCEQTWNYGDEAPLYHSCSAIYISDGGSLTEIARNTKADFVFQSEDDDTKIGATGVEGFNFFDVSASVPVSETGTVFFTAQSNDAWTTTWGTAGSGADGVCVGGDLGDGSTWEWGRFNYTAVGPRRDGVFAYKDGVLEKVIAEGDVISSGLIEGLVLSLKLPQPELRQAVAGDSIMLSALLDTDQDCIADTVGLMAATSPSGTPSGEDSFDMTPGKGAFAAAYSTHGGRVQMMTVDDEGNPSAWQITRLQILDPASAEYLTEEEAKGGLLTFTAVYNPGFNENPGPYPEGATEYPDLNVVLRLEAESERVLGLIKDLESKTDLMPTITATEDGATQMTFTIEDNEAGKDLADTVEGVIEDPAGLSVVALALSSSFGPSIPVPLMGQFFLFLLGGLVSLIGGLRSLRRRAA